MFQDNVLQSLAVNAVKNRLASVQVTLDSTLVEAGPVIKLLTLPDWANSMRIYPTAAIRFAIGEQPETMSTATFSIGAIADAGAWQTRGLDTSKSRVLQMTTASTSVVTVEIF